MSAVETYWTADQVKEFVEKILDEKDRALEMADGEREKAASALRGEQQRALDQADRERYRAAENLRTELARQIDEGDDRLREHIEQQFRQINAALESAEKLEVERQARLGAIIDALAEKLEVLRVAQQIAQNKFEDSVEGRFAQVNEFRGSLDDLGKTMATRRELEAAVVSLSGRTDDSIQQRNVKFDEIAKALQEIRSRLDTGPAALRELQARADLGLGRDQGKQQSQATLFAVIAAVGGMLGIVVVLANVLTN